MGPTYAFTILPLLAINLAVIAAGVMLLRRGWWPRWLGSDPHCRHCGYLLIGIQSERCPECGTTLSPSNIMHGQRKRRPGMALLGGVILLLGLAISVAIISNEIDDIQWYHFEPTFLVMRDLRSGTNVSAQAMRELDRRDKAGDLSPKYEQQIVEMALVQQATAVSAPLTADLIQFLEQQLLAGHLTDTQKTRFGQQSLLLHLRVRPIVVKGDWVPYQIDESCRVNGPGFFVHVVYGGGTTIDGKGVGPTGGGGSSMSGLGSGGSTGDSVKYNQVGKHQLVIKPHVELCQGHFDAGTIIFQEDRQLTANFEVVAGPPPDYFKLIDDPTLANPIKAAIVPAKFEFSSKRPGNLNGNLNIKNVPENIAFNVFARFNNREYQISSIICNKGASTDYSVGGMAGDAHASTMPSTFDLILRSDEHVGRGTIDQHSIWNGELIYPNVPVGVNPSN